MNIWMSLLYTTKNHYLIGHPSHKGWWLMHDNVPIAEVYRHFMLEAEKISLYILENTFNCLNEFCYSESWEVYMKRPDFFSLPSNLMCYLMDSFYRLAKMMTHILFIVGVRKENTFSTDFRALMSNKIPWGLVFGPRLF